LDEQTSIAHFLDLETARIDELIAQKEKLSELLQTSREVRIDQLTTRTKGKVVTIHHPSLPWLSTIPETWRQSRLKYLVVSDGTGLQMGPFGSLITQVEIDDTGYKLFGQENTISGDFSIGSRWLKSEVYSGLSRYIPRPGDILLTRKGSLGNARIFPASAQPGTIDSDTIRVRPRRDILSELYLVLLLHEAKYIRSQIEMNRRGAILSGLNTQTIANILILLPPAREQHLFPHRGLHIALHSHGC
jgi:type I restriction enzyme S subunit